MFIVCFVLVHCRVGSLEILHVEYIQIRRVHCRVGSLEMTPELYHGFPWVHCRVGSLENRLIKR